MQNARSFGAHLGTLVTHRESADCTFCRIFVRVRFEVRVETKYGDVVAVVGNVPNMGAWQPTEALHMSTTEQAYPTWHCEPLLLGSESTEIEYKFLVISTEGDVHWEPLLHNRRLIIKGSEAHVAVDWGSPSSLLSDLPPSKDSFDHNTFNGQPLSGVGPGVVDANLMAARGSCGALREVSKCCISFAEKLSSSTSNSMATLQLEAPGASMAKGLEAGRGGSAGRLGTTHVPLGESSASLVERLLVVQQYLPFNVWRAEDGSWTGAWDEWALLATPAQGGRHLMGSLNIEACHPPVLRTSVVSNPSPICTASVHCRGP